MVKLKSIHGVVIEAMPDAVEALVCSGTFSLCEGERMPEPEEEPPSEAEEPEDVTSSFAFDAFGENEPQESLSDMSAEELRQLADSMGIKVAKNASKKRLIESIEAAGAEG